MPSPYVLLVTGCTNSDPQIPLCRQPKKVRERVIQVVDVTQLETRPDCGREQRRDQALRKVAQPCAQKARWITEYTAIASGRCRWVDGVKSKCVIEWMAAVAARP